MILRDGRHGVDNDVRIRISRLNGLHQRGVVADEILGIHAVIVGAQHDDEQVDDLMALEERIGHAQSVHRLMDGVHENRRPARKALFRHKILAAQRCLQPTGPALILVEADAVVGAVRRVGAIAVSVGVAQTKDMLFHRSIPLFSFHPVTGGSSRLRPPCRRRCEAGRRGSPVPLQRQA